MAQKNKNTGLMAIIAVVIIAAGGLMAYMSQKVEKTDAPETQVEADAPMSDDGTTAEVDTAAGEEKAETANAAQEDTTPQQQEQGVVVEPGNPVVAKVDGKDITRVDVYNFIKAMPQNMQQLPAQMVYPLALEQTINTRIVQNKADEANLQDDPEVVKQVEMAKQQIARNIFLQRQVEGKITQDKVKKAYDDFIKKQPSVEERKASHILVASEDEAKAAIKRLEEGADFAELAKELSTGPTGPNGGDLGYFGVNDMVSEFATVAFSLDKGEYTKEPVKTQFGYHVIKMVDSRTKPNPTLEELAPSIEAELRRAALEDMVAQWREKVEIEQFDINGKPIKEGANAFGQVEPASN
ncbi:MAG: rotamase [Alphaproteobacteria bacterium]|nr:rotamase [Alphaproteobacteria bacterium]NCQ87826.1 rotamase [Alphaproteobacteria bacterium]NCT05666.1 rotamase [Alphaproteobacteria bacterium]